MSAGEILERAEKILTHCREINAAMLDHEARLLEVIQRLEARDELHARLSATTSNRTSFQPGE